jgi:asparagine synthase (glutamine-hydrolysing)
MSGIAGIVAWNGIPVDTAALQRMNDRLAHRGPDGEAFVLGRGSWEALQHSFVRRAEGVGDAGSVRVGLAHRRLAILDLSERGLQPMATRDRRRWIVFNGEIYNHRELRAALESAGRRFTSQTDTEVLLHAYEAWGEACLSRLEGMWAFAVWDSDAGTLFCARDRLGIKPFYYTLSDAQFAFASEIKALTTLPWCEARPDDEAVIGFLASGHCDQGEQTTFCGVRALPPGDALCVHAPSGRVTRRAYWRPAPGSAPAMGDGDHVREVRRVLVASVRKHLFSDVRAASCLSGGLDSSTVVGLIGHVQREDPETARAVGERLHTFTSSHEQKQFDESGYALAVARRVGAQSQLVYPSADDFWCNFHRIAWHQDMPFGALGCYAQWRVMRAAHQAGVKVLLDGQGGDEVFGGYAAFRYAYLAATLRTGRLAAAVRELGAMLARGERHEPEVGEDRRLPAPIRALLKADSMIEQVLARDFRQAAAGESTWGTCWRWLARSGEHSGATPVQQLQIDGMVAGTLPQLLRIADRSSMALSIEARMPLLDHTVVELGLALPDHLKVNGGWGKFALRQAVTGIMPERIRLRTTRPAFGVPDRLWLSGALRPAITELLAGELRCARYIDVPALRRWYGSAQAKTADTESYLAFFRVLSVEMWMRAFKLT